MIRERLAARVYRTLALSDLAVHAALRARAATDKLIGARLAPSTLPDLNGETALLNALAGRVRVAVDVGANIGEWSSLALMRFPDLEQLVAYEPGEVASVFRANIDDRRVVLVESAVSDAPGELVLQEADDSHLSSVVAVEDGAVRRTRVVRAVRIDDELERLGVSRVGFLKIDAEGHDLRVLRGARDALAGQRIDVIQFEYNRIWVNAGATLHEAHQLLEDAGYLNFVITGSGLRRLPLAGVPELFTYANFAALLPSVASSLGYHLSPIW